MMDKPTQKTIWGEPAEGFRLVAQSVVVLAFTLAALVVGWLVISTDDWFIPTMILLASARLAYDHFFDV